MPKYTAAQKRAYAKKMRGRRGKGQAAQKKFQLRRPVPKVARQLQPVLETKKFVGFKAGNTLGPGAAFMTITNASLVLIPPAFMNMTKDGTTGLPRNSGVEGNDVFSRYLTEKIMVEYPATSFAPDSVQVRPMELIQGWCKPLNYTSLTTPARATASRYEILQHVVQQVAEEFDQEQDSMKFKDRERRSYNIIKRTKLYPNLNRSVIHNSWVPDDATKLRGGPAPVRRNITWKMNKKVELTESSDTGVQGDADKFLYPNQAYIPFIILYNPDFAKYTANSAGKQSQIKITRNSCHWFNDA